MIFHFELRDMNTHMDTLKLKIFFRHVSILPSLYFEFMLEASPFYPLTMSLKKSHQRFKWDISQENSISRPANLCTLYIQLKQKCKTQIYSSLVSLQHYHYILSMLLTALIRQHILILTLKPNVISHDLIISFKLRDLQ